MKDFKIIEIMELFDEDEVIPASEMQRPQQALDREMFEDFNKRNPMAGGGMLVQPGFGGVRQGYKEEDGRLVKSKKRLKQLNEETALYTDGRYKTYDSLPDDRKLKQTIGKRATLRAQGKNIGAGKGSPGKPKPVGEDFVSPMKDARIVAKNLETRKKNYQATPIGQRLQWIADNGKNYDNPKDFIKAYEKHFKHKLGSKKDALFGRTGDTRVYLSNIDGLQNTGKTGAQGGDIFSFKKGFSEEEIFKASIIQNNPEIKKEFKTLFNDIYKDVSVYSELGPEGIVERLNKGKLLKEFDFVEFGVGSGITRNSLLNAAGIPTEHITSFQSVRKPIMAISQIIQNLKNPSFAKDFGISATTATKIRGQLENFFKGEKGLQADIRKINNQLGDVKFNNIFGGVNFEHTLAKQFGKDYKYLPRNYLLKGQFTTKAFNLFKRDAFDLPLIKLMKQYEQGKIPAERVQAFIDDFNSKTNGYADFSFDINKGRLAYSDNAIKYDLSRYANPNVARQELIKNIDLTMSPEFQKGFKDLPQVKDQLKLFKSKEAQDIRKLLASFSANPKCRAANFSRGGRIGYATGPADLSQCALSGKNRLEKVIKTGAKLGPQEGALATQILKAGRSLGSAFTLSGLLGPQALLFTGLAEAGIVGYDYLTTGQTLKEVIGDSLLNYALGKKTKIDPQKELFKRFSGLGYNDEQIGKFANVLNQTNTLNTILKQDLKVGNLEDEVKAFRKQPRDQFMLPDDEMLQTDTAIRAEQKLEDEQKNLENLLINYRSQPPVGLNMEDTILGDMASGKFQETQQDLQAANIFADIEKEKTAANRLAGLEGAISEQARADRIAGLEQDYLNLLQERGPQLTPFAGGGIAKLAGIDEGPQTVSMNPNSQGLSGLLKRGKKI